MITRPIEKADLPGILGLLNASLSRDRLTAALLYQKLWGDPDFEPSLALAVFAEGSPLAMAQGIVRPRHVPPKAFLKMIAVDPQWRGQGLASTLLSRIERAVAAMGATEIRPGEAAPNYLWPGVDVGYREAIAFFEQKGFRRIGETRNLQVDLGSEGFAAQIRKAHLRQPGMVVTRATPSDREACMRFLAEHWPAWCDEVAVGFEQSPLSVHLAYRMERLLGFAAYDCNNLGTGWFGPMGTAPEARGYGIGGVLLGRCLMDLKRAGQSKAIIPWVGPSEFYRHYADASLDRIFIRFGKALI